MASTMKYLFEKSFDSDDRPAARASAVPVRQYSEEELAAAQSEAHAAGEIVGRASAHASIEQASAKALAGIAAQLNGIDQQIEKLRAQTIQEAVKVVSAAIHKVVPEMAQRNALNEIERLIRECLQAIYDEPRVVVRAHDSVIATLQNRIDTMAAGCGFNGKIVLFSDEQIGETDCRIEWADGGAERHLGDMWKKIDAALTRMTAGAEAASTEPLEANPIKLAH